MVFKLRLFSSEPETPFENDVKMYGIQTSVLNVQVTSEFENDVKMYGIQTGGIILRNKDLFENDVKMYDIQTLIPVR